MVCFSFQNSFAPLGSFIWRLLPSFPSQNVIDQFENIMILSYEETETSCEEEVYILYCMYARIVSHFVIFHDLVVVTVLKML
jgi:hypothetical protein